MGVGIAWPQLDRVREIGDRTVRIALLQIGNPAIEEDYGFGGAFEIALLQRLREEPDGLVTIAAPQGNDAPVQIVHGTFWRARGE